MTSIPNTKRRGAIYWFSRSRRLPGGNSFRPTVSLRTACPKTARRRAAILSAKFEVFCMRLFGNQQRRFSIDRDAATRIFQKEFNLTLDQLEDEREHATIGSYDFGDQIRAELPLDPLLRSDARLADEFERRLTEMRSRIAIFQAKWPAIHLDSGNQAFLRESETLRNSNIQHFYDWADQLFKAR